MQGCLLYCKDSEKHDIVKKGMGNVKLVFITHGQTKANGINDIRSGAKVPLTT